jgi:hypothetical protein
VVVVLFDVVGTDEVVVVVGAFVDVVGISVVVVVLASVSGGCELAGVSLRVPQAAIAKSKTARWKADLHMLILSTPPSSLWPERMGRALGRFR